jgi:hypothetical protein
LKYDSSKWFPVFIAGKYEMWGISYTVTPEDLQRYAGNYNVAFKKSPLTIDHMDGCAYGWIAAFKVEGDTLYMALDELDSDMLEMNDEGKYRYPSIELSEFDNQDGSKIDYIRAVTMTNFNRVKNLPQIRFHEKTDVKIFKSDDLKINFSIKQNSINQTKNMSKLFLKFAEKIGIDNLTAETKEQEIVDALNAKFSEQNDEITSLKNTINKSKDTKKFSELESENTKLQAENTKMFSEMVDGILENACKEGKITPAEKDEQREFTEFTCKKENGFAKAKLFFDKMPVRPELKGKVVNTAGTPPEVDLTHPKFKDEEGNRITYQRLVDDPILAAKFTKDEIDSLKPVDHFAMPRKNKK